MRPRPASPIGIEQAEQLRSDVADAITELRALRSADPAARSAQEAIKLTRLTLECFWMPAAEAPIHPPDDPATVRV